jgi:hypothetical protein
VLSEAALLIDDVPRKTAPPLVATVIGSIEAYIDGAREMALQARGCMRSLNKFPRQGSPAQEGGG